VTDVQTTEDVAPAGTDAAAEHDGTRGVLLRRPGPAEVDPERFQRRRRRRDLALSIGTPIVLIGIWQFITTSGAVDQRFWPPPSDIVVSFQESISSGILLDALGTSMVRILMGFIFGSTIGIAVGLTLGSVRVLRVALEPIISAVYTVPKLALLPLLLLVFGIGETPKIALVALGTMFPIYLTLFSGIRGVDAKLIEAGSTLGLTRREHEMLAFERQWWGPPRPHETGQPAHLRRPPPAVKTGGHSPVGAGGG
jgi:NitT/TauT family transport system permease protein/sulfonate transport system permease protein